MANMYGKQVSDARDAFGAIASCGVAVRVTRETHLPIKVMRRAAADACGVSRCLFEGVTHLGLRVTATVTRHAHAPPHRKLPVTDPRLATLGRPGPRCTCLGIKEKS